jgi:uncharacterized GH25 family protein
MRQNKSRWLWLSLICLALLVIYHFMPSHPQQGDEISDFLSAPPPKIPASKSLAPEKPAGPIYISADSKQRPKRLPKEDQTPECLLTGKVMSPDGRPLPGAIVTVYASLPDDSTLIPHWPDPVISDVCDGEGHYAIHLFESLDATVVVDKPGYAKIEDGRYLYVPGEYPKNYTLRESCACIEGVVINDGIPIPGARVDITFPLRTVMSDGTTPTRVSGTTDSMGKYRIDGLIEGPATIITLVPGFQRKGTPFDTVCGPCGKVILNLTAGLSISFPVKSRQGHPIPSVSAFCFLEGQRGYLGPDDYGTKTWSSPTYPLRNRSSESGIVELVVPPNTSNFACRIGADKYQYKYIIINPNSPPSEVELDDAVRFSGIVLSDSGDPVPGAAVLVYEEKSSDPIAPDSPSRLESLIGSSIEQTGTDMRGTFRLNLTFSKVSQVRVTKKGFREARVDLNPKKPIPFLEVHLESQETGIFGSVVNSDGKPVTSFRIAFKSSAPGNDKYFRDIENKEGRYLISDIPAGTYVMSIQLVSSTLPEVFASQEITLKNGYFFGEVKFQSVAIEALKK